MSKKNFFSKSISAKLMTLFLAVSVIPIIILGMVVMGSGIRAIEESVFNKLEVLGKIKCKEINTFLKSHFSELDMLAKSESTIKAYEELKEYNKTKGGDYRTLCSKIDSEFNSFVKHFEFDNVLIISADNGKIMYSMLDDDNLNIYLSKRSYENSALAKLWEKTLRTGKTTMIDFSIDTNKGKYQSYFGSPIVDKTGNVVAVIALELSIDKITEIMQEDLSLDKKYDLYIVGNDYLMRSDSKHDSEFSAFRRKIKSESVELGLQHKSGTHIINNHRDVPVLSYYSELGLKSNFGTDFDWVVIAEVDKQEAFTEASILREKIIIVGLIIAFIVVFLALFFSRYITKPIIKLTEVSKIFASGNLSYDFNIKQEDEIGILSDSIKMMQGNLRKQFEEITEGVNVLFSSSSEIMATVSQLASGAAETATSVSETTSTVEEVKQTVDVSNQKATEVADSAQEISMVSQEGIQSISETIDGMNKIKQQMESIASIVIQLSEKSRTIGEIANSVGDLAEQSNLLAVNASIEAAKAGEQGKGFAVVAQEIKNLADRSKESTVQIRKILLDIQKEISSAVLATEQGGKVIDEGLRLSSKSNDVIITLASSIEQATQASIQIAASSQQQFIGMDQITSAMENIKEASGQTAVSTKQSEESVIELNNLGEKLLGILKQYKLN